jgi:hypothetical protein
LHENNVTSVDYGALDLVLKSMQSLKLTVESTNMNKTANDLTKDFIGYKAEAINLTSQFRSIVHNALTAEKLAVVKERAEKKFELKKSMLEKRNEARTEKIKNLTVMIEKEQIKERLQLLKLGTPSKIDSMLSSNYTKDQIKEQVRLWAKDLTPEQKRASIDAAREELQKLRVERKAEFEALRTQLKQVETDARDSRVGTRAPITQ